MKPSGGRIRAMVVFCHCDEHHMLKNESQIRRILIEKHIKFHEYRRLCDHDIFPSFLSECKKENPLALLIIGCGREIAGDFLDEAIKRSVPDVSITWMDTSDDRDPLTVSARIISWYENALDTNPAETERTKQQDKTVGDVMVIGGGVGGCQVALDIAEGGHKVFLIEKTISLGGTMAKLDKTFPTLDCSICILGPRLVEVSNHPNIELLTPAEVSRIRGTPGYFEADVTLWPRFVDMSKCSGCGKCAEVCPVVIPSQWNLELKPIKAIHINFEQAVPLRSAISKEYCVECRLCEKVCEREAVHLDDKPQHKKLCVGAVVYATGAVPLSPVSYGPYGYGYIPAVISNIEFERLVCATGPTGGKLVTPEGAPARKIAFIQCVGSRNKRYNDYCSIYCCPASIKEALLALEHEPYGEVTIFFNDIRTAGKGFEELYRRAQERGVRFVKGLPSLIEEDVYTKQPIVHYYDMETRARKKKAVDLVVLAVGLVSDRDSVKWEVDQKPSLDQFGFYLEKQRTLHSLESSSTGIFLLGTCHGPRDITQTVSEASGVAGEVQSFLSNAKANTNA